MRGWVGKDTKIWKKKEKEHILGLHLRDLLLEFIWFMGDHAISKEYETLVLPCVYEIIENLMIDDGIRMDTILEEISRTYRPVLREIFTKFCKGRRKTIGDYREDNVAFV